MDPVISLKRPSPVDYSLCIFCQTHKARKNLSEATEHGLTTLRNAACSRKKLRDSKNIDLIDRLENALDSATAVSLVWHRMCYAHFTDKRTQTEYSTEGAGCSSGVPGGNRCSLWKGVQPVNWSLCIFCQTANKKARLISVMTKQMSDQIIQVSHLDYKVGLRLAGVIDLIAAEAKYHLPCLSAFNRSTSKTKQESANRPCYDMALPRAPSISWQRTCDSSGWCMGKV